MNVSTMTPWSSCCFNPLTTTTATTPSTPLTLTGNPPPCMAYPEASSGDMPNFARNLSSSPAYLQCMSQVLQPQRKTVLRLRATQRSLSGDVPDPTAHWNSTWPLASEMDTSVGLPCHRAIGCRRACSRWPSS